MQGLNRVLAPIKRSLKLLVNRGVMSFVSDEHKRQNVQIRLQSDEVIDDAERFQNYGFSSVPSAGEVIAVEVGGKRSHIAVLVVDDKGVRPTGLKAGDVVVYHQEGHSFLLTEQGEVVLTCKKFTVRAEQEVLFETPQTRFSGDVDIVGQSTAKDHVSGGISGKDHNHEQNVGKPV
ncbi:phage baseplate assembly protein V [Pasteurella canis]|uniref:phage baseplate assembly protein V n=1 Tax=Pasteurella TaxID=745 RepID=UPI001CC70F34|nr:MULTISPECIES: phage baseplate assembly protein V [Pasteurella]UAY77389.1 phage baseplate assembly protein V [Pasteurella canis]WRK07889.1 phage baseplate assembly protein V [Pasteurella multocida]HDX1124358.1 phage baseplate assembly protein V [Pasteurella multocida]HDX1186309.1 phage baseplate assembly protein V [Pasteurella multocida]